MPFVKLGVQGDVEACGDEMNDAGTEMRMLEVRIGGHGPDTVSLPRSAF